MDPYLGEIRLFSFAFAPKGWATCDGQSMSIGQNQALYSLLGVTYGGDAVTTFNLPDFRGRTMLHKSSDYPQGKAGGQETVSLTTLAQLPLHTHLLEANSAAGGTNVPKNQVPATVQDAAGTKCAYASKKAVPAATLAPKTLSFAGASAGHNNMQPSLTINYCIALTGTYPMRP